MEKRSIGDQNPTSTYCIQVELYIHAYHGLYEQISLGLHLNSLSVFVYSDRIPCVLKLTDSIYTILFITTKCCHESTFKYDKNKLLENRIFPLCKEAQSSAQKQFLQYDFR